MYVIEGDTSEVKDLYKLMGDLKNRKEPLVKNNFGTTFLGCLLAALGYEWKSVDCQGAWYNLEKNGNTLRFTVETILSPCPVVFDLVCRKFPSLTNYYRAENHAAVLYETNDGEGKYFPEKYRVELSTPQDEFMMKYFFELPAVFKWFEKIFGQTIKTEKTGK